MRSTVCLALLLSFAHASGVSAEEVATPATNQPAAVAAPVPPAMPELSPAAKRTKELAEKQALLKAEFDLQAAELRSELADLLLEKQRLDAEMALADTRRKKATTEQTALAVELALKVKKAESELKVALSGLRAEKETLSMEMSLREERNKQAALEAREEIARIKLAMEKKNVLQEQELQDMQARQKTLTAQNMLQAEENKAALAELATESAQISAELAHAQKLHEKKVQELNTEIALLAIQNSKALQLQASRENEHKAEMTALQHELAEVQAAMTLRETRDAYRNTVDRDIDYPADPFRDGVLTVSDRRIKLNDVIMEGTADYVTERIHYFNNQSTEAPIFIVIDRNPGGSVMEGYRIIKAMDASKAPIHVVIKSFAASMAATIATAAQHSYAYPNAILLHHQPSGIAWGNLTQQDEQMVIFKEWARRLHATIAEKMGLSMDEFYEMMYEKNSDGDWQEFADVAQELHWINHVVTEIREEGILKKPEGEAPMPIWWFTMKDQATPPDPKNNYVLLPQPKPFDYYFMYNPNGYYRWTQ
ncbi:MAG: ATP-dependent Clp protease proteolytic subunit [Kiritimatiellia bacterium]|nr:ATP-dependent Clp protease proteolytic subunit [Kiritimatiellia bacterium]MDP6631339.1 ATP-dependent Clp protease proteolytic subunit [Kiritimatiellia bacterium]MDP6809671.1 ATP-dependent Clp protease proteolytic subunit [Kiritimatiellia bacterium]MDP7023479.1 ATP-dependent Clp protease proteolytic subunit [Kiritimatiellia bacterium]